MQFTVYRLLLAGIVGEFQKNINIVHYLQRKWTLEQQTLCERGESKREMESVQHVSDEGECWQYLFSCVNVGIFRAAEEKPQSKVLMDPQTHGLTLTYDHHCPYKDGMKCAWVTASLGIHVKVSVREGACNWSQKEQFWCIRQGQMWSKTHWVQDTTTHTCTPAHVHAQRKLLTSIVQWQDLIFL